MNFTARGFPFLFPTQRLDVVESASEQAGDVMSSRAPGLGSATA